jgi:hypothetical protein
MHRAVACRLFQTARSCSRARRPRSSRVDTRDGASRGVRPFTTTDAPSAASAVAIASPIPAMEPILTAVLAWTPQIHLPACLPRPFAVATPRSLAGSNRRDSFALHRKDLTPEEGGNRP